MEELINRIRAALYLDMTVEEICDHFVDTDMGADAGTVFLAYHAALILEADAQN
jgi:hypothetical protein